MRERIEKILNDKKITQAEFADYIGVNRSSITHIMTGRNKTSDTVVARTLLAFPDINPQWLSEGIGDVYKTVSKVTTPYTNTYSNNEMPQSKQEDLFAQSDMYKHGIQHQNAKIQYKQPMSESNRQVHNISPIGIIDGQEKEKKTTSSIEKQIRKIVFFYADKTFEEYYPE